MARADFPAYRGAMLSNCAQIDLALRALLDFLKSQEYRFTTITPASHERVLARNPGRSARTVEDVLGWSLPFDASYLPKLAGLLHDANALVEVGALFRSKVRVSSLRSDLYLHSAFPADHKNTVFFGPDSYRFADAISQELQAAPLTGPARVLDIGTGTGVGGIIAARASPSASVVATDVNSQAVRLARINAAQAGVELDVHEADGVARGIGTFDLILMNPPYLVDPEKRLYRDGGGARGADLALRLVRDALPRLRAGGRLLLYTGSAIVGGEDALRAALAAASPDHNFLYRETDPDVFGEELDGPDYLFVDRIALVTALFRRTH